MPRFHKVFTDKYSGGWTYYYPLIDEVKCSSETERQSTDELNRDVLAKYYYQNWERYDELKHKTFAEYLDRSVSDDTYRILTDVPTIME